VGLALILPKSTITTISIHWDTHRVFAGRGGVRFVETRMIWKVKRRVVGGIVDIGLSNYIKNKDTEALVREGREELYRGIEESRNKVLRAERQKRKRRNR
jgi:hypothetical protein